MSDKWQTGYIPLHGGCVPRELVGATSAARGVRLSGSRRMWYELPIWEGDKIFFRLMEQREAVFSLKLRYVGDTLVEKALDGRAF